MAIEGLRHILCPVDFSELSALALRYASAFSRCGGAALTALYANPFLPPAHADSAQIAEFEEQFRNWHADAALRLRAFTDATLADPAVNTMVVEALPVDGIRTAAEQLGADLVVVGTHGQGGENRLMMGSVAERILRESPVPVLTVRSPGETLRLGHLLCAVNDTGAARRAFAWTVRMARCFGSRITTLHVGDQPRWVPPEVEYIVRQGEPAEQIVAAADELNADMLVLGTQHRLFHGVHVIGNVTAMTVRHASCPVLTVIGTRMEKS